MNWIRRQWASDRRLVCVVLVVNGIVAINAVRHTPFTGYDALDHIEYVTVLSTGRLPGPDDTSQFFVAPLPYVAPAALTALGVRWGAVLKLAQMQNVLFSLGLSLALVQLCRHLRPGDRALPVWTLVLLGSVPMYYKMFAFVRGEPLTAFLSVLLVERIVAYARHGGRLRDAVVIGASAGMVMLSKQWGAFVVVPAVMWMMWRRVSFSHMAAAAVTAVVIAGPFYASLWARFGSMAAFNVAAAPTFRVDNRTVHFFTDVSWPAIVVHPVREAFDRGYGTPLLPLLYADAWGDYWCYWVVRGQRANGGWMSGELAAVAPPALSNREEMAPYLGRVNLAGLAPTLVMVAGVALAFRRRLEGQSAPTVLMALIVMTTFAGYVTLLLAYPDLGLKSGYQLHALPFLALLGAMALAQAPPRLGAALRVMILLAALHNAPVFFTRYDWFQHW